MIDPRSQTLLQELARRESRSLLRYLGDAFPWTTIRDKASLAGFQQVFHEEGESLNVLIRFLGRSRIPLPPLGAFPLWFTTINFVSLKYLQPQLVEAQRSAIVSLEKDLSDLTDSAARTQVERMLDLKRRNLHQLEALAPVETLVTPTTS